METDRDNAEPNAPEPVFHPAPTMRLSSKKTLGVLFIAVLLIVVILIVITAKNFQGAQSHSQPSRTNTPAQEPQRN